MYIKWKNDKTHKCTYAFKLFSKMIAVIFPSDLIRNVTKQIHNMPYSVFVYTHMNIILYSDGLTLIQQLRKRILLTLN